MVGILPIQLVVGPNIHNFLLYMLIQDILVIYYNVLYCKTYYMD